jgi:HAMP domain-containing protein
MDEFVRGLRKSADNPPAETRDVGWEHVVCSQLKAAADEVERLRNALKIMTESNRLDREEAAKAVQ